MQRIYKPPLSSYIGYSILFGGIAALAIVPLFLEANRTAHRMTIGVAVELFILAFIFWWLSRFRLIVGSDAVIYSTAFRKDQHVSLPDIQGGEVLLIREGRRLWFAIKTDAGIKMRINHKVFSREAYQDLSRQVLV